MADEESGWLKERDGVWYVHISVVSDSGETHRVKRSTRIRIQGKPGSRAWKHSRQLAEQRAIEYARVAQREASGLARPKGPTKTLEQAIAEVIQKKELARRSQHTIDIVLQKAVHLFSFFGPQRGVAGIDERELERYAAWALESRHPGSVDKELKVLRQAIATIAQPPKQPDIGRIYTPRERFLEPDEIRNLLAELPEHRRDYMIMYIWLGLSYSELYRISPNDIDWEGNQVHVRGTKAEQRKRTIPMTPEVREVLTRRCARVSAAEGAAPPLFSEWKKPNMHLMMQRACKRAGMERVNINDLRRTFATLMARAGVPALHLKELMGHSTTRMLEKVYARVERGKHLHDAVAHLPRLHEQKPE